MSDPIAAYIRVGGTIPKRLVESLCLAIAQEEASLDWGEAHFSPAGIEDLLENRRSVDDAYVLTLYDDNARWGEFAALEKFLIEHGVAFDRHHEAKFDVNARLTQFRPESGRYDFNTTVEGHVVVPLRDLHYLRDDLQQVRGRLQAGDSQGGLQRLQEALESLARRVRDPAPPLSSLEFSD